MTKHTAKPVYAARGKPKSWRTYYGYNRPTFTAPAQRVALQQVGGGSFFGIAADASYIEWLMVTRDMDSKDAIAYAQGMDRRKLISAHHVAGDDPVKLAPKLASRTSRFKARTDAKPISATHVAAPSSPVRYVKRCALYARISKDSSDTDNQLHQLRCWALGMGYELVGEYLDSESGGKGLDKRPELARMLTDAEAGLFDIVGVWALDRLTREGLLPGLEYLQRLNRAGVCMHSFTEPVISTDNPVVAELLTALALIMAKQERLRISARTKAGLDRVRRNGSKSGRPIGRPGLAPDKVAVIRRLTETGEFDKFAVAAEVKTHWKTVLKYAA